MFLLPVSKRSAVTRIEEALFSDFRKINLVLLDAGEQCLRPALFLPSREELADPELLWEASVWSEFLSGEIGQNARLRWDRTVELGGKWMGVAKEREIQNSSLNQLKFQRSGEDDLNQEAEKSKSTTKLS